MPKKVDIFLSHNKRTLTESLCQSENRIHGCTFMNTDSSTPGFPFPSVLLSERISECGCAPLGICEKVLSVGVCCHRMRRIVACYLVLNILACVTGCNMEWR